MIAEFQDQYRWLSNFWMAPITVDGKLYSSVEHAYQAAKATTPEDIELILNCKTPGETKKVARRIKIRPDWDKVKVDFMYKFVKAKFEQNNLLRKKLLDTGSEELVEGNWWGDVFWGICNGKGQNHLGKILMRVRDELKT